MTRFNRVFFSILAVSLLMFSLGCGGGGGSGSTTPPQDTEVAPTAVSTLSSAQNAYSYSSIAQNLVMTIPVISGQVANFLLTVNNNSAFSQDVVLTPATSFAASLQPQEKASLQASQIVPDADLVQMAAVKGRLEQKLRQDTIDSMRRTGGNLRAAMRPSDHSGETVGSIYSISMVSSSTGLSYITRSCKLERITAHCKIFLDQDSYSGLSAVSGSYMVTSSDLDHFANEFETYIYPLMSQNYGSVYDIDNDSRLSIIISPVYAIIGFAGLFNSIDMTPGATTNSNQRDMIGVWSPSSTKWQGEYWRAATRETIAHEMQHATNYSAKVYPGGVVRTGISNYDNLLETMWIDEGLSVGAEARYRANRAAAGEISYFGGQTVADSVANDNRFNYWVQNPETVKMDDFSYEFNAYEHYGQKGLFNFYLYEQFGADKIKALVQTTTTGMTNFENVFGSGSFASLVTKWQFAVTNEGLRTSGLVDINAISAPYRYQAAMKLSTVHQAVQYDAKFPESIQIAPGATAYYVIRQPSTTTGSEYQFIVESAQGQAIKVDMMRLP